VGRKSRAKAVRRAQRAGVASETSVRRAGVAFRPATGLAMLAAAKPVDPPSEGRQLAEPQWSNGADHLKVLVTRHHELLAEIESEVRNLLDQGHSWTQVGNAIGLSRQGARQRYRHLVASQTARQASPVRRNMGTA
jgi:hypothetical protein